MSEAGERFLHLKDQGLHHLLGPVTLYGPGPYTLEVRKVTKDDLIRLQNAIFGGVVGVKRNLDALLL